MVEQCLIPHPNSRDPSKPMKKLQDLVLKLAAQALPNAALPPPVETLLRDRLDHLLSHYTTPDHPPYSAVNHLFSDKMIQNALQELNEKGGSTKKSVSQHLQKRYDNLPWPHSLLLKHHLERTSESGEIVVSRTKKYFLAGSPNLSTKVEHKPRKRRKWRLECDRQKHYQLKLKFIRERNKPRGTKVEALLSCVDGELIVHGNPTILQNEKKYTEEVSTQLENDTSEIAKLNISEHHERERSELDQLEVSTPERPPGFEFVRVENLYQLASTEPEPAFVGEVTAELITHPKGGEFDSLQSACNIKTPTNQEQVLDLIPTTAELVTLSKDGEFDSLQSGCNMETPTNQEHMLDLIPITLKQQRHEKQFVEEDVVEVARSISNSAELMRNGKRGRRRNNKLKKLLLQNEHVHEPSLSSKESESALSTGKEPREKQVILQGMQLRRSLRIKPSVAKDANTEEHCPVTVCRRQDTVSKQRPTKAKREESQGSSKSRKKRMILEQKPDPDNQKAVDNFTQSGKLEECAPSMHEIISKQKARKQHWPPTRRSKRLRGS